MNTSEIILSTGPSVVELDWVPQRISRYMGQLALLHGPETQLILPSEVVRNDETTLFACSGVQIIYPQLFDGVEPPGYPQLISQPVIRTQHLPNVREGTSTSFVNYNLIMFGESQDYHERATNDFFEKMIEVDQSGTEQNKRVRVEDWEQNWNGLPVMMNTNDKLWINGVELGESIFYGDMLLPSGETVSVSELAFGLERLFYATEAPLGDASYFRGMLGGIDTDPTHKDNEVARVCDALKSCTLMAMQGVVPSNKAHGYRMRKFLKQAVRANVSAQIDTVQIVENAFNFWSAFMPPAHDLEKVQEIVRTEYERNANRHILERLEEEHGVRISIDINQTTDNFLVQLKSTGRLPNNYI